MQSRLAAFREEKLLTEIVCQKPNAGVCQSFVSLSFFFSSFLFFLCRNPECISLSLSLPASLTRSRSLVSARVGLKVSGDVRLGFDPHAKRKNCNILVYL